MVFIANGGIYCYKVMAFVLENAGATCQRLVTTVFQEQIEGIVKVCIDDMVVKCLLKADRIRHLEELIKII